MQKEDELTIEMKAYEQEFAGKKVDTKLPICIRLDGKNFSKFTKDLEKPFDDRLADIMKKTMNYLVHITGASVGYTQSDEISLIIIPEENKNVMFNGKIQKISSVLAAKASVKFNKLLMKNIPEKFIDSQDESDDDEVVLDARLWNVPTVDIAMKTIYWRMKDAKKNSISMCVYAYGNNKDFVGKGSAERISFLKDVGKDWDNLKEQYKTGILAIKVMELVTLNEEQKKIASKYGQPDRRWESVIRNFTMPEMLKDFENSKNSILVKLEDVKVVKSMTNQLKKRKTTI